MLHGLTPLKGEDSNAAADTTFLRITIQAVTSRHPAAAGPPGSTASAPSATLPSHNVTASTHLTVTSNAPSQIPIQALQIDQVALHRLRHKHKAAATISIYPQPPLNPMRIAEPVSCKPALPPVYADHSTGLHGSLPSSNACKLPPLLQLKRREAICQALQVLLEVWVRSLMGVLLLLLLAEQLQRVLWRLLLLHECCDHVTCTAAQHSMFKHHRAGVNWIDENKTNQFLLY